MAEQPRHREPSHYETSGQQPGRGETYEVREPQGHAPAAPPPAGGSEHGGGRPADPYYRQAAEAESPFRNIGRRVSWGAIFAGVFVALSVQLLLSVLGIGIGAAVFDPAAAGDPGAWTIGAGVWWVITGLIALFLGGWVAGHLATNPDRRDGAIHGVVTWSLATLIGVWLLTTTLGTVTAGAWTVMVEGQQMQMPAGVEEMVDPQQDPQQPPQQQPQQQPPQPQQEEGMLQDPQQQQLLQQADDAVAQAGIWTFIAMVLGAVAAALGGFLATPRNAPDEVSHR